MNERQRRFAQLYEEHGRHVLAWALRRMPREDAEDLLSETFAVCWRRLDDMPPVEATRPWLYGVAAHLRTNQLRGQQRRERLIRRLEMNLDRVVHAPDLDGAEDARMVRLEKALTQLRPADVEVLRLSAWEGLGPSELAVTLDCTANAASIRLHRARRALSAAYDRLRPSNGGTT